MPTLSIHRLPPRESGGEIARIGFNFQDHVAVSFLLEMLENALLKEVWCETHDDITLIWNMDGSEEVEFVQVKSNELDQLWTLAKLVERKKTSVNPDGRGTSILEKSLGQDRCIEPCRFKVVTNRPENSELSCLTLPLNSRSREASRAAIDKLKSDVGGKITHFASDNGHDAAWWIEQTQWQSVGTLDAVQNSNLHKLEEITVKSGTVLNLTQRRFIYQKLLQLAKDTADAKWQVDANRKKISRQKLIDLVAEIAEASVATEVSKHSFPTGQITFLLTDIEESTRKSSELGSHSYLEQLKEPHDAIIKAAISTANGHIFNDTGDGYFASFQDPQDAISCACEIQQKVTSADLRATDSQGKEWALRIRVGIHTATEAVTPDPNGNYHHSEVNFAARVGALAGAQQIIVSDSTYEAIHDKDSYQWLEWSNRRIKSFDQPQTVRELLWDGRSRGEPGARWLPEWFAGERNTYIERPLLQDVVFEFFDDSHANGTSSRLVTLHGPGGIGKTRLAIACAIRLAGAFQGNIFFVSLEGVTKTEDGIAEAIGRVLDKTGAEALPGNLLSHLRDKNWLLILDNYESVDNDEVAGFIGKLVTATRALHLLVTGREVVKLDDIERIITVNEGMNEEEAYQLFIARSLLKMRSEWVPSAEEEVAIYRIIRTTEGVPLALELTAAWANRKTLTEIADGLEATPLGSMTQQSGRSHRADKVERFRSINRCLDWSFNLLEPWEQEVFCRIGVFVGSFSIEAFEEVCIIPPEGPDQLLARFQDASLVKRLELNQGSRYSMLLLTRAYAAEKMKSLTYADSLRETFMSYFCLLLQDNYEMKNEDQISILESEWPNIMEAIKFTTQFRPAEVTTYFIQIVYKFAIKRGFWPDYEQLSELALNAVHEQKDRASESEIQFYRGNLYRLQGKYDLAMQCFENSLDHCRNSGEKKEEGRALNALGTVHRLLGNITEAEKMYQKSLAIAKEVDDKIGESQAIGNLGNLYIDSGSSEDSRAALLQSLDSKRSMNDQEGEALVLGNLAALCQREGKYEEAHIHLEQSLRLMKATSNRVGEANVLSNIGSTYASQQQWDLAQESCEKALELHLECSDLVNAGIDMGHLVKIHRKRGFLDKEELMCVQRLNLYREIGQTGKEIEALDELANVYARQGKEEEADECCQQELLLCRKLNNVQGEGKVLMHLALMREARGNFPKALEFAYQARDILSQVGNAELIGEIDEWVAEWEGYVHR